MSRRSHPQEAPTPSLNSPWIWELHISCSCIAKILSSEININTGSEQVKFVRSQQQGWNCSVGMSFLSREYEVPLGNISPAEDKFTIEKFKAHKKIHHYIRKPSDETSSIHRREQKTESHEKSFNLFTQ